MPVSYSQSVTALRDLYLGNGLSPQWQAIEARLEPDRLAIDYGIASQVSRDLASFQVPTGHISDFKKALSCQRREIHRHELRRLYRLFRDRPCKILAPVSDLETGLRSLIQGGPIVEGADLAFSSRYWGDINLARLNKGMEAFRGGEGQVALLFGLSFLNWDLDLVIGQLPGLLKKLGGSSKDQDWKKLPIDWRKAAAILRNGFESYYDLEGYKRFTHDWGNPYMAITFTTASALLTKEEFREKRWGKSIPLHVDQVEIFQGHLQKALQDAEKVPAGEVNLEGYMKFARLKGIDGNMQKAYVIASALLSEEEFEKLRWGKQILLHVDQIPEFQAHLQKAIQDAKKVPRGKINLEGYMKFARLKGIDGNMQKAFMVASALLSEDEFKELRWGKMIPLHVDQVESIKEELLDGLRSGRMVGREAWQSFARRHSLEEPQACRIAAALLPDNQYQQLGWVLQAYCLADDLIMERLERFSDEEVRRDFGPLISKLVRRPSEEGLALHVVKWALAEKEIVPDSSLEGRAFGLFQKLTATLRKTKRPAWQARLIRRIASTGKSPEELVDMKRMREALLEGMWEMNPTQKSLVEATVMDDVPIAEVARKLGLTLSEATEEHRLAHELIRQAFGRKGGRFLWSRGGSNP